MDALQFEQQARQDPHLSTFLREVAEDTAQQISVAEPQRFVTVTGADLLFSLVAYALYRWAKDFFDHRRALNEIAIAEHQAQLIKELVEAGFLPKDAQATVAALFKGIAKRTEDDPAFKTVRTLIGKGK
ncbi:MAG: hypothetical protein HY268_03535 [Deltaproteobacteria bacterium]|nr:hypothetical protein [Deltaproteobacteria bacterium]